MLIRGIRGLAFVCDLWFVICDLPFGPGHLDLFRVSRNAISNFVLYYIGINQGLPCLAPSKNKVTTGDKYDTTDDDIVI